MKICILNTKTKICENIIQLETIDEFSPYKDDVELAPQHDGEIGWIWTDEGWIDTTTIKPTLEQRSLRMRRARDAKLRKVVDTMNPIRWETMSEEQKQLWIAYRQALLDLPNQPGFPFEVVWPEKPA